MRRLAEDTPIEIERIQVERMRVLSPAEKMERMVSLNCLLRGMVRAEIRRSFPEASEAEINLRSAARWLPPDLMLKAFGWPSKVSDRNGK